jgi:hypothetical protein
MVYLHVPKLVPDGTRVRTTSQKQLDVQGLGCNGETRTRVRTYHGTQSIRFKSFLR